MPVTQRPLASAILHPMRSVMVPTTAGHQVRFQGGMATVNDTNDLPFLMRRSDVKMIVNEYAMSWMPEVLAKVYKIEADVEWPEGYAVTHHNGEDFDIIAPEPPQAGVDLSGSGPAEAQPVPCPPADPPVDPIQALDAVLKETPKRWRKPPNNSSAS